MRFRYSLRALDANTDPIALLDVISENGHAAANALGGDELQLPWREAVEHLKSLGAETLLIQHGVIDPDYLDEHQAFYAKQHRPVPRKSIRVHAFNLPCPAESDESSERHVLRFLDQAKNDNYLGFVTVRPLRHAPVGATILKCLPDRVPTVSDNFTVHITGNDYVVHGTPFLQQDSAVGACAQASMWMALRALRRRHGNTAFSPAELTEAATRYLAVDRPFPGRRGLTIGQMLDTVRFAGHDPLHVLLRAPEEDSIEKSRVVAEATPYIESGLPVLFVLAKDGDGHVVVGIGVRSVRSAVHSIQDAHEQEGLNFTILHQPASNWARGVLVHNDAEGPYGQLLGKVDDATADYSLEDTCSLIVMLPDGIFTTAGEAKLLGLRSMWRACSFALAGAKLAPQAPEVQLVVRSVLCTRHAFRNWARDDKYLDDSVRDIYRTHELPPYVWVIEIHDGRLFNPLDDASLSRYGEVVLDASADRYHADSHLFTSIVSALWPSLASGMAPGVLLTETDTNSLSVSATRTGQPGPKILKPWLDNS